MTARKYAAVLEQPVVKDAVLRAYRQGLEAAREAALDELPPGDERARVSYRLDALVNGVGRDIARARREHGRRKARGRRRRGDA